MQITLIFDAKLVHPTSVGKFARYCKSHYDSQTSYHKDTGIVEIVVDSIYKNNVIHTALSYGFTIVHV
jgi:hypothetical protein